MDAAQDPATEPEQEYVELEETEWADTEGPETFPDGKTVQADRANAQAPHEADRPPTPEEEAAAPTEVDPSVAEAFEDANERGANVKGEGEI